MFLKMFFVLFFMGNASVLFSFDFDWTWFEIKDGTFNPNDSWIFSTMLNKTCPNLLLETGIDTNFSKFPKFPEISIDIFDNFPTFPDFLDQLSLLEGLNCPLPTIPPLPESTNRTNTTEASKTTTATTSEPNWCALKYNCCDVNGKCCDVNAHCNGSRENAVCVCNDGFEGCAHCKCGGINGNKCRKIINRTLYKAKFQFSKSHVRRKRSTRLFSKVLLSEGALHQLLNEICSTYAPYILNSVDVLDLLYEFFI